MGLMGCLTLGPTDGKPPGVHLRIARMLLGLRQADLAAAIGVAQHRISDWERNIRTPTQVQAARLDEFLEKALEAVQ